jgi:hypothetical protein
VVAKVVNRLGVVEFATKNETLDEFRCDGEP